MVNNTRSCEDCKYLQIDDDMVAICLWCKEVGMLDCIIHDPSNNGYCCEMWKEKKCL